MSDHEHSDEMRRLLDQEVRALDEVMETLDQEREALMSRDTVALELATRRKTDGLAAVDHLEQRRRELAPDLHSMEQLATVPEVASRWERVLDLTRQSREQNEANGRMIRRQQRRVASTLQLLRGESGESDYGPGGEPAARAGRRPPIASA